MDDQQAGGRWVTEPFLDGLASIHLAQGGKGKAKKSSEQKSGDDHNALLG
jgi:hypothetical protein